MSKKNEQKYDPSLVSIEMIRQIARVRAYGINKHGHRLDWQTTNPNEHFKAARRHLDLAFEGEEMDSSGYPHIVMAVCNLMFEIDRKNYAFNEGVEVEKEFKAYDPMKDDKILSSLLADKDDKDYKTPSLFDFL